MYAAGAQGLGGAGDQLLARTVIAGPSLYQLLARTVIADPSLYGSGAMAVSPLSPTWPESCPEVFNSPNLRWRPDSASAHPSR